VAVNLFSLNVRGVTSDIWPLGRHYLVEMRPTCWGTLPERILQYEQTVTDGDSADSPWFQIAVKILPMYWSNKLQTARKYGACVASGSGATTPQYTDTQENFTELQKYYNLGSDYPMSYWFYWFCEYIYSYWSKIWEQVAEEKCLGLDTREITFAFW
jgi:hypothetical protein